MARPAVLLERPDAGRVEPARLAVRIGIRIDSRANAARVQELQEAGTLAPGCHRAGPVEIELAIEPAPGRSAALILSASVRNTSERPVQVDALILGFTWTRHGVSSLRTLRHGWQSWSVTEGRPLDDVGEPPFPSGPWLGGMFRAVGESPPDRAGWHESELVTVVGASPTGPACLVGVYERGETFGIIHTRMDPTARGLGARVDVGARVGPGARLDADVAIEVELRLEVPLAPGATRRADAVRIALGADATRLLEDYAEAYGRAASARTQAPFQAGWCSWYHFFHDVTEDDVLRNLDALVGARGELPIDVVQLDDGYQRAIGDWLETNPKFPRGLAPIAAAIRGAGFTAGLWTAPFCVAPDSQVAGAHGDWLLRQGDRPFRGLHHAMWTPEGWIHVLDASQPAVLEHLEQVFRTLAGMGFSYQKLDFLYTEAMQAEARDQGVSRAQRLRRGLEAVRRGCGESAFLLGCGCPLGPAVGIVDGMRIGPDVAPSWHVDQPVVIPGLAGTHPSTRNGVRNTLARAFMHRRLWLNDPDCLMVRATATKLTRAEAATLGAAIAVTGGMVIFSDDVPVLDEASRALVRDTTALSREADAGKARVLDVLGAEIATAALAKSGDAVLVALINGSDTPRRATLDLHTLGVPVRTAPLVRVLGSASPAIAGNGVLEAELGAHESVIVRLPAAPPLAVFCDFDGTFAVQDVGSTLAKRYAAERRPAQLERLARGELIPWEYNLEILDRLPVSQAATDAFLRTVELDPGARALIELCESRGLPFRILSDGFDRNLEELQRIHGVRFEYDANRLWFEDDRWRIAAVHLNPACGCGTGNCKRSRIGIYRAAHPGTRTVHIGNGRVSDRCGALAADLAFAKGTLAEALAEEGAPFERFDTLHDVVRVLRRELESLGSGA